VRERVPPIRVQRFSAVTSTNDVAREMVSRGDRIGALVVADHQTAGRGRRGRRWFSPPGVGLWATWIVSPPLEGKALFTLGLATAVGICKAVEQGYMARPAIQWPNDLLLDGRKFCGILVEVMRDRKGAHVALIGMGINLNQQRGDFPPSLRGIPTSIREVTGKAVDRKRFLEEIKSPLRREVQCVFDQGFEGIKRDYLERSNLIGKRVTVRLAGGNLEGRVVDFSPFGELMIRDDARFIRTLTHGEVHRVWR